MLSSSFSYLPVLDERGTPGVWRLLSDRDLARYLRERTDLRKQRLAQTLKEALADGLMLIEAAQFSPEEPVEQLLCSGLGDRLMLIVDRREPLRILGVLSAFDLL